MPQTTPSSIRILVILSLSFAVANLAGADNPAVAPLPQFDFQVPALDFDLELRNQSLAGLDPEKQRIERLEKYFRPPRIDSAAISPDGKYIAHSSRDNGNLSVVVVGAGDLSKLVHKGFLLSDRDTQRISYSYGAPPSRPAQILWMAWFPPARLAVRTNHHQGGILAINADGSNPVILAQSADESSGVKLGGYATPQFCTDDPQSVLLHRRETILEGRSLSLGPFPGEALYRYVHDAFKLNIVTGALTLLNQTEIPSTLIRKSKPAPQYRTDRQGNARIWIESRDPDHNVERRYHANIGKKTSVWRDLEKLANTGGISGFVVPPATSGAGRPQRSIPIGFDTNPDILYYASNVGRAKYGIHTFNLATNKPGDFALEDPERDLAVPAGEIIPDNMLVFDRHNHTLVGVRAPGRTHLVRWLQPDLQFAQATLDASICGRVVSILGWTEDRTRYLAHASGPVSRGAYYLYDRRRKTIDEFANCAPWLDGQMLHPRTELSVSDKEGRKHPVAYTIPAPVHRRANGYRAIVLCRPDPGPDVFRADAQAFAEMGYVAIEAGTNATVILAALDALAMRVPLDPKRIALFGERSGAVVALRLAQTHPERFRCAIAVDVGDIGPLDAKPISKPVYILNDPAQFLPWNSPERSLKLYHNDKAKALVRATRGAGAGDAAYENLPADYQHDSLTKAGVYSRIESFLFMVNTKAEVILGPTEVIEENVQPGRRGRPEQ